MPTMPPANEPHPALVDVLVQDCQTREGVVRFMYLDHLGNVTVGIGNLLATVESATRLPFRAAHYSDTPARESDIADDWYRVKHMRPGLSASLYLSGLSPLLPVGYAQELCRSRIVGDFLPGLRRLLPAVDTFPQPAVRALVAMAYALGMGGLAKYVHLLAACNRGDWASAAGECRIRTARDETNARNVKWFLEAGRAVVG